MFNVAPYCTHLLAQSITLAEAFLSTTFMTNQVDTIGDNPEQNNNHKGSKSQHQPITRHLLILGRAL